MQFNVTGFDPVVRASQFIPVVSTRATSFVAEGTRATDVLTFAAVADSNGVTNPWFVSALGNYAPLTADGTLYGPFAAHPTLSATVPAGAPVAATASVTTSLRDGPTVQYSATSNTVLTQSGYYTWVWSIDWNRQPADVQRLIPGPSLQFPDEEPYYFQDEFGLTAETSIVPMRPEAVSQVSHRWADAGQQVTDSLTVSNANGFWLSGTRARFEGTAYGVLNGSVPVVQDGVPSGTRILSTQSLTFSAPGTQTTAPITVPSDVGSIVWVWRFTGAAQAQPNHFATGYTWADQFGLANETTHVRMAPVLTTQVVEKYPDGAFNDQVTLSVAQGRYVEGTEVVAYGTLYGPITDRPTESSFVPAGTPIAHAAQLTFRDVGTLTTDTGFVPEEAGHYTWVWRITSAEQSEQTQDVLPAEYEFVDRFGIDAETSVKSMEFGGTSAVTQPTLLLGEESVDTLDVWLENGEWLQRDGQNIAVTFRGSSYFVAGEERPEQSPDVPENAELVQTVFLNITEPGLHTMPAAVGEETRQGFRVWVWEVRDEDQVDDLRGMSEAWADEFGMPDETQDVLVPTVRTLSQAGAGKGGTIQDTAFVTGPMPLRGAELTFEAYAIPMVQNENGKWVIDFPVEEEPTAETPGEGEEPADAPNPDATPTDEPEGEEPVNWDWVVAPENLIGSNLDAGEIITEPGEYVSPKFTVSKYQKVLWVESLWTVDPALAQVPAEGEGPVEGEDPAEAEEPAAPAFERQLIHRGIVGLPNETTFVLNVKTYAMSDTGARSGVEHGIATWDTAELTGYVPEDGTLEFEGYIVPVNTGGPVADSCTPERLAWTSPALDLEGGLYPAGSPLKLTGAQHVFNPDVDSALYWVAVVKDELGREVSRGVCGDPDETVGLKGQKLLRTDGTLALGGVAVLLLIAGATVGTVTIRRRRTIA